MTQASLEVVTLSHTFAAPRDRVWRAWTDPEAIKQWFGRPEGADIPRVEMDARIGGRYRIEFSGSFGVAAIVGRFHEVSPPERLTFSFAWEEALVDLMNTGRTIVTIEFREVDGGTEVVLVHERLRDVAVADFHAGGWGLGFARLDEFLQSEWGAA